MTNAHMQRHVVDEPISFEQTVESQKLGQLDLGKDSFVQVGDDEYAEEEEDKDMNEAQKLKFKEDMDNLGKKAEEVKAKAKAKSLRKKELAAAAEQAAE